MDSTSASALGTASNFFVVEDYYTCLTWAEYYSSTSVQASVAEATMTQSWQNFSTVSTNGIPCNQFIPLDSWEQCEKRRFDNEWLRLTSANLTWIASPDLWSGSAYTNVSTSCDYWLDVVDYATCQSRARYGSASDTDTFFTTNTNSKLDNPYLTDNTLYDCWEFQTSKTGANCVARAGTGNFFFEQKARDIDSYGTYKGTSVVSCAHYYFDECEDANEAVADQLTCKAAKCKALATAKNSDKKYYLNFDNLSYLDCWYYDVVDYAKCGLRAAENTHYSNSEGPLASSPARSTLAKAVVRYKEDGTLYYVDCFTYTNMDYAACATRAGVGNSYFSMYKDSSKTTKDCWTYATTHDYSACITRCSSTGGEVYF